MSAPPKGKCDGEIIYRDTPMECLLPENGDKKSPYAYVWDEEGQCWLPFSWEMDRLIKLTIRHENGNIS